MSAFKKYRIEAGLTQQAVASVLGIHQSTVAMWETSENKPRAEGLRRVAQLYNCTVDDLLREAVPEAQ